MLCWIALVLILAQSSMSQRLDAYNIDPDSVTVSGLSAGAAFAVQMHVTFSGRIRGLATLAGVPYWCTRGLGLAYAMTCMTSPAFTPVGTLTAKAEQWSGGNIDDVGNLQRSKVFVVHGGKDDTVKEGNSDNIAAFYEHFDAELKSARLGDLGHAFPTEGYGAACPTTASPYINNCDYDAAGDAFNFFYGVPQVARSAHGYRLEFDQDEFVGSPFNSFDDKGLIFVPQHCHQGNLCKLHVSFHGCLQGREYVDSTYARHSGFEEAALAHDAIVLFPQIKSAALRGNPNGCFDWWGYDGLLNFAHRGGVQMKAVISMIERMLGD